MAKPPAAASCGIVFVAAVILLVREPRRMARQLALTVTFTLVGLAGLALVLPLETILAQTRGYMEMHGAAPPAGRGPLSDLLAFLVHPRGWPFAAALIAIGLATQPDRHSWGVAWGRAAASIAIAAALAGTILAVAFPVFPALGPGMAAVAYAAIALALVGGADRRVCLALALGALLPWAAAVGSTNDLPSQTTFCAGIFGLVALLAARSARPVGTTTILVALALVLITGSAIWKGLARPYRLAAPVWSQNERIEVGGRGERVSVDPRTAAFMSALRESARRQGFCAGDPVIDLSGELPGVAVVLGGRTPGLQWLFGGYPFSEKLAGWVLSGVDAQTRARAWLVAGEGRIAFSAPFIAPLGFALSDGYDLVLDARHPLHQTPVRLYCPRSLPDASARCPSRAALR